jgi:gliding motility-associated-like protein
MKIKNNLQILFLSVSFILLSGFRTYSQQIFATTATEVSTGNHVDNIENATSKNDLFATVNSNGGFLLGTGAYSGELKLEFSSTVPANTTTYIKVDDLEKGLFNTLLGGSLGNLLADAGGTTAFGDHFVQVTALDNSGVVVDTGNTNNLFNTPLLFTTVPLKVLKNKDGDIFITITPTEDYKAVVIKDVTDALLLGVSNFINVYHAFYPDPANVSCNSEEIFTSYDGTGITLNLLESDLENETGLGTTGVRNAEFAIDTDPITFSTISVGIISAQASMYQDVYFSTTAAITDELDVSFRPKGGSIVNVAVSQNITIELFNEEVSVFSQIADAAEIVEILPAQGGDITKIKVTPGVEFDRLRVTLTSPLGVNLDQQVDLFNVKVTPETPTITIDEENQSFCAIDAPKISDLRATTTGTLIWYDKATQGTAYLASDALVNGTKYYAANVTGNCESSSRVEVTVTINDAAPPTTTNTSQSFCATDNPTIADLDAIALGTITWYDQITGGNAYVATDPLINGTKYYATDTGGTSEETCESSERLEVSVTVQNPAPPTTTITSQNFCAIDQPTIADLDAIALGTITWYDQITGGNAYVTTDPLVDGTKYYATDTSGTSEETCESTDRLEVSVTVQDPTPPTTTNTSQSFCATDNPTIADLDASVTTGTIIWYDQATNGNAYNSADALEDGFTYYATNSNGTCEGSDRLEVSVTVQNPTPPTSTNTSQSFCAIDEPTIADLDAIVTTGTIVWYDQATDGNAYNSADALEDGFKYYATNSNGTCEGTDRLEVSVTIQNPEIPTTTNTSQSFCAIDQPTIADLEADASGTITWYDQITGGNAYVTTDPLVDGTKYYATDTGGTSEETCESSERLEVSVTVQNPQTPTTTNTSQSFCATDNPTIADLDASITTGTIIWYDQATDGNAYNSADALEDGFKYYATNSNGTCEGSDRLEVSVTVQDPTPPTSTNTSQSFCAIDQPTIADLDAVVTNGTIIWYDQATDGNAYNSADALEDGFKYYATNSNGTCEGTDRLEVTVAFQNPETPTGNANQSFCIVDQPTIANLEADASGTIIWYDQPIEGTAYSASDALVDGLKYYAANSDGACESTGRLEVTVEITDTPAPTTTNTNQSFCSVDAPVISDLEATTTGTIVWYDQATNGSAYNATDALEDGLKYYASNNNGTCESSERLEVTVAITTAADITIQGNNSELCYRTIETYEVPTGYAPYTWSATGGEILSGGTSTDSSVEIEWTSLTDTKVSVSLTGGCFNANAAEQIVQVVVCSDLTIKNEVDFIKPTVEDLITFTIDVQNSSIYVFKDVNISQVLIDGFRYVSSNTSLGSYNESNGIWSIPSFGSKEAATLTIKAKVNTTGGYLNTASIISSTPTDADTSNNTAEVLVTPSCLEFYNIITPNEDGANDFFVISCIDNYKDTDLEIFDRYGSIIYKQRNYNNDWDGIANQTGKIIKQGQKLPSGTYFFVLKFNDGSTENIKSYIQIIR